MREVVLRSNVRFSYAEVDMKQLVKMISLLAVFCGCGFAMGASMIPRNEGPKTALLVLDMQEDFLGDKAKMPINQEQIPAITAVVNSLIDEFEKNGQPIIYIKSEFPKIAIGNRIRNHAAIKGSPGTDIYKKIRISGDAIFSKKVPDAFSNPDFEKYLAANQINRLVITGVYADQCVLTTTLAALKKKYQVTFIRNGVGSSSEKAVNKACEKVKNKGGEVIEYQPNMRIGDMIGSSFF
jgi:nicotinamidase-related amidase